MGILNGLKGAMAGAQRSRQRRAAHEASQVGVPQVDPDARFCTQCGHIARPGTETPGSIWIEAILWLAFIVPGLIYSVWRHNKRHAACPKCGSAALIPADSPKAQAAIRQMAQ